MGKINQTYNRFGFFCLAFFLGLWLVYPYIQAEILSNLYLEQINGIKICQKQRSDDLKNLKLIRYNPNRGEAVLDCIYIDSRFNVRMNLSKRKDSWEANLIILLNKPSNLYWPIYF
jgi:hypothetical protein